jgi:hypothetical protein
MFTASHKLYADSVLNYLDPNGDLIKYRLYRHNCAEIFHDEVKYYVKDLRVIRNVDISNMVIIDNSVLSFAFQLENGIPILPFYDNKGDNELLYLADYLNHIGPVSDLRVELKKSMKMDYFLKAAKKDESSEEESSAFFSLKNCEIILTTESDCSIDSGTNNMKPKRKSSRFQQSLQNHLDEFKKSISSYLNENMGVV